MKNFEAVVSRLLAIGGFISGLGSPQSGILIMLGAILFHL